MQQCYWTISEQYWQRNRLQCAFDRCCSFRFDLYNFSFVTSNVVQYLDPYFTCISLQKMSIHNRFLTVFFLALISFVSKVSSQLLPYPWSSLSPKIYKNCIMISVYIKYFTCLYPKLYIQRWNVAQLVVVEVLLSFNIS